MTVHVLVLRALGLGDFLTAVPALRAIDRALAGRMAVAMSPDFGPLLRWSGISASIHPATVLEAAMPPAELAINLHGSGPESHRALRTKSRRLVAFACPEAGFADGPTWDPDEHERVRWCRLLAEALGIRADPSDLLLTRPDRESLNREPGVVIHPGAAQAARRWPVERFADVARWASGHGLPVTLTGTTSERELCERVASLAGGRASVAAGSTSLTSLAAMVAHADVVLVGDTGVGHLAAAFRTPSVHLFGPVSPSLWGPPEGPHSVIWRGGSGDPHGAQVDRALADIGVPEVIEALEQRLGLQSESVR